MTKLSFGVFDVMSRGVADSYPSAADMYDDHIQLAAEVEQKGYEYYFSIEHQSSPLSYLTSPNVYFASLARNTSVLRFGMMIYQMPFHHPIRLAQESATLDHLSRGRFEFGVGTGISPHEFIRWNIPYESRREQSHEALEVIKQAWSKGVVTFEGKHFNFVEVLTEPRPFQDPHPPIWYAAHSPHSFEFAAKHNFNVSQNIDVDSVVAEKFDMWRKMLKKYKHAAPTPLAFLTRHVHVAETDEKAREQAEPHLVTPRDKDPEFHEAGQAAVAQAGLEVSPDGRYQKRTQTKEHQELRRVFLERQHSYDFWIDNGLALVGSPETVTRKLKEQQDLIQMDIFCARHGIGRIPMAQARESIELFSKEVMPAFK